jgi:hypothetical protein
LTLLDRVLLLHERELLARRDDSVFLDVGLGDHPSTTLESAAAMRALDPALRTIGVDVDPIRVRAAARAACPGVEFRRAGFALTGAPAPLLRDGERARLVRAMNVVRGYDERDVPAIHAQLSAALAPGGLVVEGTSAADGGGLCAHLLRRGAGGLAREALCFITDFRRGFAPLMFRDCLPRDLRRHAQRGEAIGDFLYAWQAAFERARTQARMSAARLFCASARELPEVATDQRLLEIGCLIWQPSTGVPQPSASYCRVGPAGATLLAGCRRSPKPSTKSSVTT